MRLKEGRHAAAGTIARDEWVRPADAAPTDPISEDDPFVIL